MDNFKTADLRLAAYLLASQTAELTNVVQEGRRKIFHFDREIPSENIADFYNGTANTSALRMCEALYSLRMSIYSG